MSVCVPARVGTGVRRRHAPPPPRNPPHCAPLAQEQRQRPRRPPGERAARCCHRRRAPLPFKSVSKPITADLPRDVLPSVSRSELPEDSPPDLPRVAPPQPAAGSAAPATLGKAAGARAPSRGHSPGERRRLPGLRPARRAAVAAENVPGRSPAPLGPARRRAPEAARGALWAASGKGAPFANLDSSERALGGAGREMVTRQG